MPTAITGDTATVDSNPFSAAVAAGDIDALVEALSPHPVLHSAVTRTPFEGREVLADLYASVFEAFDDLRVVDEFRDGDTFAFFWEGHIDGREVSGADRLRLDADGKVREVTVVGRPVAGLLAFVTGIGSRFARRRRGVLVARLLRLTALPLAPLFSVLDPVTRWLVRGRGA